MTAEKPPVVEEVGAYRPGICITSDKDHEKPKSGISTFDAKTGKTETSQGKKS